MRVEVPNLKEISITDNGDLRIDDNGDIAFDIGGLALLDHLIIRLRTYKDDAPTMPGIGSRVEDFAGLPATEAVVLALEAQIKDAFLRDNFMRPEDIGVVVHPLGEDTAMIYIDPDLQNRGYFAGSIDFDLNLTTGRIL